jgi:RimJ/RimL family protein N-acetyltransferase
MKNKLFTQRLLLDIITTEDFEFIQKLVNTKGWLEFIGDRKIHSKEDAVAYINKINSTPNFSYWVVRTKNENIPVGIISFLKRNYLDHYDIGFAFLPEFNGLGYAYEAAKEVLNAAKENPEYTPVLATTLPHNTSSIKLLNKLGLEFEKEIEIGNEKLLVYSSLSEQS